MAPLGAALVVFIHNSCLLLGTYYVLDVLLACQQSCEVCVVIPTLEIRALRLGPLI